MQKPKPPLPADRERGKVYITGHEVMGSGEIYTAIEYTPENGDTVTYSAGPNMLKGNPLVNGLWGELESKLNRSSDDAPNNQIISEVTLPEGVSPDVFMKNIQAADEAYCDCINYDLLPEDTGNHILTVIRAACLNL